MTKVIGVLGFVKFTVQLTMDKMCSFLFSIKLNDKNFVHLKWVIHSKKFCTTPGEACGLF